MGVWGGVGGGMEGDGGVWGCGGMWGGGMEGDGGATSCTLSRDRGVQRRDVHSAKRNGVALCPSTCDSSAHKMISAMR